MKDKRAVIRSVFQELRCLLEERLTACLRRANPGSSLDSPVSTHRHVKAYCLHVQASNKVWLRKE